MLTLRHENHFVTLMMLRARLFAPLAQRCGIAFLAIQLELVHPLLLALRLVLVVQTQMHLLADVPLRNDLVVLRTAPRVLVDV